MVILVMERSGKRLISTKKLQNTRHILMSFDGARRGSGLGWLRDETGSFEKISHGGRVPRNISAMTVEREALRMGIERLTVLFPTKVSLFVFKIENSCRTVQYKLDEQSLRLFGHHSET